jgi:putative transposase
MCKVLKVSRSGYYEWLKRVPSNRDVENQLLMERIRKIYNKSKRTYGSPRITVDLKMQNVIVSRQRVARLMKRANIRAIAKKRFVSTTNSRHQYPIAPNLLKRSFTTSKYNEVWVSDITYVQTGEGWMYLTVVIDLWDRKVIGWSASKTLKAQDTVIPAWKMAISQRPITEKLIFHSDRGVQYACHEFKKELFAKSLVTQSMSRKGDCWDNAVAESFFKTIKTEWIYKHKYFTRKHAELSVFEYIETWYNTQRRHSSLNYLSPAEFGKLMNKHEMVA